MSLYWYNQIIQERVNLMLVAESQLISLEEMRELENIHLGNNWFRQASSMTLQLLSEKVCWETEYLQSQSISHKINYKGMKWGNLVKSAWTKQSKSLSEVMGQISHISKYDALGRMSFLDHYCQIGNNLNLTMR